MRRKPFSWLLILALLSLAILGGLGVRAVIAGSGGSGGVRYSCDGCPGSIGGPFGNWVVVQTFMDQSGCYPAEARCWTDWIAKNPNAIMEMPDTPPGRIERTSNMPDPDGWPPFGEIVDEREWCHLASQGGKWGPAAGTWYLNAYARPGFPQTRCDPVLGECWEECRWTIDTTRYFWFFGENDECLYNSCEPNPTPGLTPTCSIQETPMINTPEPAPSPTPVFDTPPEDPTALPMAYIRSTTLQPDPNVWYGTDPHKGYFAWLSQHYLNAKLTADVTPSAPAGCSATSWVEAYYFMGVNDVQVCQDPLGGEFEFDPSAPVILPPEGLESCRWRDPQSEEVHLLWTREATAPTQAESWNFYNISAFVPNANNPAQDAVLIRYKLRVRTSYVCNGYPIEFPSWHDMVLRVNLIQPERGN